MQPISRYISLTRAGFKKRNLIQQLTNIKTLTLIFHLSNSHAKKFRNDKVDVDRRQMQEFEKKEFYNDRKQLLMDKRLSVVFCAKKKQIKYFDSKT